MAIEVVRDDEDLRARRDAALDGELERAAGGLTPTVSTKAAARYLGVHVDTLGEWRRSSPPLGPPFQKGAGGAGGGANQHVRYAYADLQAWRESRAQQSPRERRLLDELEQVTRRQRELELELALRQAKDEVAKLQKKLGRTLAFDTLHDVATAWHPWAMVDGRVLGHALAIDEGSLERALSGDGEVWDGTLANALLLDWASGEAREPYDQAFLAALRQASEDTAAARAGQREGDLDTRLGPGASGNAPAGPTAPKIERL